MTWLPRRKIITPARRQGGFLLNPYRFGAAGPATWSPAALTAPPDAWINDDSAFTLSGSAVSQQNDISGNGYHFTQATGSRQPQRIAAALNGRAVVRYDGLNDTLINNSTGARDIFRNVNSGVVFAVYKKLSVDGSGNAEFVFNASVGTSSGARISLVSNITGALNRPRLGARRLDADSFASVAATTSFGTDWIMVLAIQDWSTGTGSIYIDGDLNTSSSLTSSGSTSNTASQDPLTIGGNTDGGTANQADMDLAELFLIGGGLPDTDEIDKIFGYAAHRWGLTDSLDVSHPYKTDPPEL